MPEFPANSASRFSTKNSVEQSGVVKFEEKYLRNRNDWLRQQPFWREIWEEVTKTYSQQAPSQLKKIEGKIDRD